MNPVDVTDTSPAIVVADAPRDMSVVPTGTLEFVSPRFGIVATLEITQL